MMIDHSSRRFRMTRQREIILQSLQNTDSHPTADEVYQIVRGKLPRISLGTVYRNLDVLFEQGLILKLELGGPQRRYDGRIHRHFHARCVACDRVFDVPAEAVSSLDVVLPDDLDFDVTEIQFEINGVCGACRDGRDGPARQTTT